MKTKEFNLSELGEERIMSGVSYRQKDVKKFIRLLKEAVSPPNYYGDMMSPSNVIEEIDKLAGEKLKK
jgi:hypothetical protein